MNYSKKSIDTLKDVMRENRKWNAEPFITEQSLEVGSTANKSKAPFSFYLRHLLKRGDKPPRGKFFKSRVAGIPVIFSDELWNMAPSTSNVEH